MPASIHRHKRWRRDFIILALLIAALWWSGPRLLYFGWTTAFGTSPNRQADFSQLSHVLPPPDTTLAVIYRGLPHQMWASGELFLDLFTTTNRSIGGYRFYTTPIPASDELRRALTTAMRTPALYRPYRGPKACGGYHPDYCFEWHSSQGMFLWTSLHGMPRNHPYWWGGRSSLRDYALHASYQKGLLRCFSAYDDHNFISVQGWVNHATDINTGSYESAANAVTKRRQIHGVFDANNDSDWVCG